MAYTEEQSCHFTREKHAVDRELQVLMYQTIAEGRTASDARVLEYLVYGVARRIRVLRRSIEKVFLLLPPSAQHPVPCDSLDDVQINLHAFFINLSGIFDNWAWAYVFRHDLEAKIGDRRNVGLFNKATQSHLPHMLREYLESKETTVWHGDYLKSFRDALAHRIPLYVPPALYTLEDSNLYNHLEKEKVDCIKTLRFARLQEIEWEQPAIGDPCLFFMHSFADSQVPTQVYLHPQMLSDARSIAEFGTLFLKHWNEGS